MPLSDIVDVVITRQSQTVTEAGFGTPMILGTSNHFVELIRFYSSMDEVAVDFDPSDPEYIAAQDIFSQVISPNLIAIGRRQVDDVTINVETAMPDEGYVLNINGNNLITTSSSSTTYSEATLDADLVPGNQINPTVNSTPVSITTQIDFNTDFVTSNSIVATVNGDALSPVVFATSQAVTIGLLATAINNADDVTSATVTGPRQITVVFDSPLTNVVNSVVTTLGASQPTATITQKGFQYAVSHEATMNAIANAIGMLPNISTSEVSSSPFRVLTVEGPPNTTAIINSFSVTLGATQPNVIITNPFQSITRQSVATAIVASVLNAIVLDPDYPVTAIDNFDGTFTLQNRVPGTPFTLRLSTSIANPNSAIVRVTQVSPNQDYTVTLNGISYTYRSLNAVQSANEIAFALVDIINAVPQAVAVDATNNNDGSFEIASSNLNNTFSISVSPEIMSFQKGLIALPLVAVNPVATDLDLINNADDSWYALIATERTQAVVKSIADWVEPRIKLFGTASSDLTIINVAAGTDTTSIAAVLNQAGYVRTFVMYHQDALTDYPEAAWFGRVLPLEPGSETWKFKTLNTISYSNLTTTQQRNALGKKANIYVFVGGVGITENGTVAQGEYIDIVRGVDWLTARIQEFVFSVLVNTPKVPYTDAGIAVIQAQVLRALALGVSNQFLSDNPAPICTVPLAIDVPPTDKANRILRNVRFQATLSGAIHAVVIRGTLSV